MVDNKNINKEQQEEVKKNPEDEKHTIDHDMERAANEKVPETTVENKIQNDIEKLQKQLSESESLIGTYKDQLLRLAAEFENYRKRVEADRIEFIKYSNEKMIRELLPILDDFERALANSKSKNPSQSQNSDLAGESFYKGVQLIYQKLFKLLEDKGVKPIDSIGKEFDVTYHDVLMQVPRSDIPPHIIIEEIERGYTLYGKVIKHAKVIVAAPSPDDFKDQSTAEGSDPEQTGKV